MELMWVEPQMVGMMLPIIIIGRIHIMRQLCTFSKMVIFLITLTIIAGYNAFAAPDKASTNKIVDEIGSKNYYSISFIETSNIKDLTCGGGNKLSFMTIQVNGMSEERLSIEDTVNKSIREAMTSWVEGKILNADSVDLTITCYSARYLSFVNSFVYESNRIDAINDYVTIDMLTGQRVYLNDLVEINEDFVRYLQENSTKFGVPSQPLWQRVPDLDKYTTSELLDELNKCSYTQEEIIQNGYYSIEESIGSLIFSIIL